MKTIGFVTVLIPAILNDVQQVYDSWNQDADGYDDELGTGGICQDIADAICFILSVHGIRLIISAQS